MKPGRRLTGALLIALALAPSATAGDSPAVPVTGKPVPGLEGFDRLMTAFLTDHALPGAALAVGRNGKLVYSRGFGHADCEKEIPVEPGALFRIASISKPLTAVAVLQLVERGKLKLDDGVCAILGLSGPEAEFDPRWRQVTIRHLLEHRGGWDRNRSFDPMFRSERIVQELDVPPPALPDAIIRYMLARPLDFNPGKKEVYSNFGYCLLGRVIEKVGATRYEDYVRREVLAPLGIHRMRLGRTLTAWPDEVRYYAEGMGPAVLGPRRGRLVPWPYGGWCLEAMDAHGGWVASAEDLVRFCMAFDDPARCPILKPASIASMFAAPAGAAEKNVFYRGWMVRPSSLGRPNISHSGSLDGTSAVLVRRVNGLTWAVLFNSRKKVGEQEPAAAIYVPLHRVANAVKRWPQ